MKVLLDVDTGVDDSIALLYALFNPEIEVVGISTVCGNVEAWLAAENTLKILDLAGAPDIPVAVGEEKPSCRRWEGRVNFIHGDNGLGNTELPASSRVTKDMDVSRFHMELAEACEGELVVLTLGPLTNIARTLKEYPGFAGKVKRLVMMGGTLSMRGNVSPVAEANVAGDPQACDALFTSGLDVTVVGLDVTMKTRLRREHLEWLSGCCRPECRPAVDYMRKALVHYMKGNQVQNYCMDDCPLHDPLAVMCAAVPSLVRTESRKARVECEGTYCRGMIVTDLREHTFNAEYVRFAVEVDEQRAVRELMSVFWEPTETRLAGR